MQLVKGIYQTIYFLLELSMLASFAYSGFHSSRHVFINCLLGIGLPILAILLWGYFAAPRSAHRLSPLYLSIFALTLFGISAFLLYRAGQPRLALLLGAVALTSELIKLGLRLY
ncbi:YrdB family protein [Spirosoma sp. KNUC1025]|uniref:YrdB family protein n=1 Tax=Spirosoma sp. KNUC1025 TaxID=2894082 RepID=UPI003863F3BB|nr:YrdB family protein [Spirosoma sp. KNUC1025]